MKHCTCPRIATARGLLPTGDIDARCPVHRVPDPPQPAPVRRVEQPRESGPKLLQCEECGLAHEPDVRCDFVDED
jgi:hypothetical protein